MSDCPWQANLILDEIRLNIHFNFAIPRSFHLFSRAPFRFKSKTIYKDNNVIKAKLFGKNSSVLDNQTSYSACPKDKWIGKFFS